MDIQEWKAKNKGKRNYAHFDKRVSLDDVWSYITNPKKVQSHSFYPFIHYTQEFQKYSKDKGKITKEREICYSAHIDRCIFQYYGYKLNQFYNRRVESDGIGNSVIAYRDSLGKNNIHFAKQAISFIRNMDNCYIIVGDFTKFFDSLDHAYLKKMLKSLLQTEELPPDYYAVYKNITKFSKWDRESLLKLNGLPNNQEGIRNLNELDQILSTKQFKEHKKHLFKDYPKNTIGIPQGSAISSVLSNIYMLDFDKKLNDYIYKENHGLYMRYSDDFIIVLPKHKQNEDVFMEQFSFINTIIKSIPNLVLQPDKSQIFEFRDNIVISCNELVLEGVKNGKNILNYLGFTFDGNVVTIRAKTLTKYYYRMYRKLKNILKNNGRTKEGKKKGCNKLYEKYSVKGANGGKGNFISYVKRSETIFGKGEAINRGTKNHMRKIRRKLDIIKY